MIFLTGGASSGKSRLAVEALAGWAGAVSYIATGLETDEEMTERIAAHRRARPAAWELIEEPIDLAGALGVVSSEAAVIVDCLTLWVSNLMESLSDEEIVGLSDVTAETAAERLAPTIVVSNEVGSGLVPLSAVGRRFRDLHGRVNQTWAGLSEEAYLTVAGRTVVLGSGANLLG